MKKKGIIAAAVMCMAMFALTGCAKELSNDYVKVSEYKGVKVEKEELPEVTEKMVDARIEGLQDDYADSVAITDRAAEYGDIAIIDYVGTLGGVAFDGGTATGSRLELGSHQFIEGFEEGIVGHNVGEKFDLNLTFPAEYHNAELAGQEVVFSVTLNGIEHREAAELNSEFVKKVSAKAKTVKELKEEIKESIEKDNEIKANDGLRKKVWDAVLENAQVLKYPEEDVKDITDQLYGQYQSMAQEYGMEFADFLSTQMNMDEKTFAEEVEKVSKSQVKQKLVLEVLMDNVDFDFSEEALEAKYQEFVDTYGFESVEVMKNTLEQVGTLEELERMAKEEIILDWLVDHAKQV